MEHFNDWFQWLTTSRGSENLAWFIGCTLLVCVWCVWCVGFRMAQPRETQQGALVPSSPWMFGLVVFAFVVLASALAFAAYDFYMQAYVYR